MKNTLTLIVAVVCLLVSISTTSKAQLYLDNSYSADTMLMDFFNGHCATISNVDYHGDSTMMSFFDADSTGLGVHAGIFFSSGNVHAANNPASYWAGEQIGVNGDSSLDALSNGYYTLDASVVEFDLVPDTSVLSFNYVFGSEEYPEYVNSGFNDIFAFLISGPNPAGGFYVEENIATLTNDSVVCINNVNDLTNSA